MQTVINPSLSFVSTNIGNTKGYYTRRKILFYCVVKFLGSCKFRFIYFIAQKEYYLKECLELIKYLIFFI